MPARKGPKKVNHYSLELKRTAETLDTLEELRYPDRVLSRGMELRLSIFRDDAVTTSGSVDLPKYHPILEDIDIVVKKIFEVSSINPQFYLQRIPSDARRWLEWNNRHAIA
jgi:hypothetical protein